jgi:hypothetical protein
MLRVISIVCLLLSIALLSSCMPRQDYHYTPPVGKLALNCISSCKVATNSCMQICAMKNSTCRAEKEDKAAKRFATYKSQRNAQGLPVTKTFEDFVRTSGCQHSCNCIPSYNTCYSACGGYVD